MATEVCDDCYPPFEPEYISVKITLHGKYRNELMNGAVSYISTAEKPTVEHQREIANKIAKTLRLKVSHTV